MNEQSLGWNLVNQVQFCRRYVTTKIPVCVKAVNNDQSPKTDDVSIWVIFSFANGTQFTMMPNNLQNLISICLRWTFFHDNLFVYFACIKLGIFYNWTEYLIRWNKKKLIQIWILLSFVVFEYKHNYSVFTREYDSL